MAEVPFAIAQDVADRWRPLTSTEFDRAQVLIADASDIIREAYPDVGARLAAGTLQPSTLVRVVAGMVKRSLQSPGDGITQDVSGPFSTSFTNPTGDLYLTAIDRAALSPPVRRRAFAVDL